MEVREANEKAKRQRVLLVTAQQQQQQQLGKHTHRVTSLRKYRLSSL